MSARLLNGGVRWPQGSQQRRYRIVVRLLLEGLGLALVLAFVVWAIITFGSQSVAVETHSPVAGTAPTYAVVCSALERSQKGAAPPTASVEGADCLAKAWPHTTTSRRPGARVAEQEHKGDR